MHDRPSHWFPVTCGIVLITLGLIANEWLVARLLSHDAELSTPIRVAVWLFDLTLIAAGIAFIAFRRTLLATSSRLFFRQHPNVAALLLGCALVIGCVIVVEAVFYGLNQFHTPDTTSHRTRDADLTAYDPLLGHRPKPSRVYQESYALNGETLFEAEYTIDENRCRVVPGQQSKTAAEFLLICGGSFAFGTGVHDDETMAYYVAQAAPDHRVYNLANIGDGPHHALAIFDQWDLDAFVREEIGLTIYVFIPQHIPRTIGTMRHVTTWGRNEPVYRIGENKIAYLGPYHEARPWRFALYQLLAREQILRYLNWDIPQGFMDHHLQHVAGVLKAAQTKLAERFDTDRFYVLLHPLLEDSGIDMNRIRRAFKEAGLRLLDYYDIIEDESDGYFYPGDRHPTPKTHRLIANNVLDDLGLRTTDPRE